MFHVKTKKIQYYFGKLRTFTDFLSKIWISHVLTIIFAPMSSNLSIEERIWKVSQLDIDIVQLLAEDKSREDIATSLNILKKNLDARIDRIRKKMNVESVPALVALFFRHNLIK